MENLKTARLIIRDFKQTDGPDLYEYLSDEEVVRFEPYKPLSRESAYEEAKRRFGDANFLAVCLHNGKLIGNLYFAKGEFDTWEVGYVFNKKYWGKGYAIESLKAMMRFAFENLPTRRIIAMCDPQNINSWRLLERAGMRREGTLLQNVYFFVDENNDPIWKDTYEYAILKTEFKA
ncbi:MAG: GNAT family N-acetyltransferase [Clostridia bacterium]|nr:GNAT family N-acetyltransferase [Clostridia bacterium]